MSLSLLFCRREKGPLSHSSTTTTIASGNYDKDDSPADSHGVLPERFRVRIVDSCFGGGAAGCRLSFGDVRFTFCRYCNNEYDSGDDDAENPSDDRGEPHEDVGYNSHVVRPQPKQKQKKRSTATAEEVRERTTTKEVCRGT